MNKSLTSKTLRTLLLAVGICGSAAVGGAVATTAMSSAAGSATFAKVEREVQDARTALATPTETAIDLSSAFKQVSRAVEPSVVHITTRSAVDNPASDLRRFFRFGPDGPEPQAPGEDDARYYAQGNGSGVIMQVEGSEAYVLTNNHVVASATEFNVHLSDGRVITDGQVVGTDPLTDLAVVKIKADRLIAAPWGESGKLEKGDWVVAFGSPFGYVGSMTTGIVSALNRQVGILGRTGFENFIQTDAAINPGNSGGPLVNLRGQVIGINSAIASRSGSFSGLGFAVPSDMARPVFERLKADGKITRGWLGVSIADVASPEPELREMVESTGYKGETGVFVMETVRNGPAQGKVRAGDVITAVDGKNVANTRELRERISQGKPGTEVKLTVVREGKNLDETVKLGELPANDAVANNNLNGNRNLRTPPSAAEQVKGLEMRSLNGRIAQQLGVEGLEGGAAVTQVQPGSAAFRAGLRPGDVITKVNGQDVATAADAAKALRENTERGARLTVVNRDGSRFVLLRDK